MIPRSTVPFTKMTGAGNDFVVLDNRAGSLSLTKVQIARLCDRRFGIGGDGLLAVEKAESAEADFRMRYYNADGGEAEMCGNGARCFGKFVQGFPRMAPEQVRFSTPAGVVTARFQADDTVEIDMTEPADWKLAQSADFGWGGISYHFVNTGVPHVVVFTTDVGAAKVFSHGRAIRESALFAKGTNVNFVQVLDHANLRVRTYERGVEDETLACGTGVVAAALVTTRHLGHPLPLNVRVQSGQILRVNGDAELKQVTLCGPAIVVFRGEVDLV